ncbi:MAG: NADH-quinone oxidoreductase subunit H, partial [Thermoproteus sp.]|nr:NADH-quinone oxidoreductase subunit H [Thermoproteus sp.]
AEADKVTYVGLWRELLMEAAYEVPLVLSIFAMAILYGTDLSAAGAQWPPGALLNPLAFAAFFVSGAMATSRMPFEIPDADAEIVFGPYTEYGSSPLLLAFGAKYVELYALSLLGAVLFLGGWAPLGGWAGAALVAAKAGALTAAWLFLRAVYPRMRIDQALRFGWRWMLLMAAASVALSAILRLW